MNRYVQSGIVVLLVALSFTVALTTPPEFWSRAILGSLIVGGSLILNMPFAVAAAILTIPADFTLNALQVQDWSPNALDLLIWAGFVGIPLVLSGVRDEPSTRSVDDDPDPTSKPSSPSESAPENVEFHPEVNQQLDPSEKLRELHVNRFERAHEYFQSDNLVYFHVRDDEARPGYVVNDTGDIKTDVKIDTSQARGLGWVLRHEEELEQHGDQIDWRNLQYHKTPINLESVRLIPVAPDGDLIGVLAFEWENAADVDDGELEAFVDEIEALMAVDQSVRQLEEKEREVKLLKRISDLEPFSTDGLDTLKQRITDMVRELIPADHVQFVTDDMNGSGDETVVNQRRLFYKKCCEWIRSRDDVLRIKNVDNFSYQGKRIGKIAPPDVSSFLGGAVVSDGDYKGFICLDDASDSYFSSEDETLLKTLLEKLTGLLTVSSELSALREEKNRLFGWFDDLSNLGRPGYGDDFSDDLVELINRKFSLDGTCFYSKASGQFNLISGTENLSAPAVIPVGSSLVTRLEDCTTKRAVNFPNLRRLSEFGNLPADTSMIVCPSFSAEESLEGFVCLFSRSGFDDDLQDDVRRVWSVIDRDVDAARRLRRSQQSLSTDDWSGLPTYDAWKRSLGSTLSDGTNERVTLWTLRVPGFGEIEQARGRQRAKQWVKSLANRLEAEFPREVMTRSHGTAFYGFSMDSTETVESTLDSLLNDIIDWSFPTGTWPEEDASIRSVGFQEPFPDVGTMVEATQKELFTNSYDDEEQKEPAPDGA